MKTPCPFVYNIVMSFDFEVINMSFLGGIVRKDWIAFQFKAIVL